VDVGIDDVEHHRAELTETFLAFLVRGLLVERDVDGPEQTERLVELAQPLVVVNVRVHLRQQPVVLLERSLQVGVLVQMG